MSTIEKYIAKINLQLHVQAAVKALLSAIAVAVFSGIFLKSLWVIVIIGVLAFFAAAYLLGLFKSLRAEAIQILHQRFPNLEFSLELLDKRTRNIAEELQWERVNSSFKGGEVSIWHERIWPFLLALGLAAGIFALSLVQLQDPKVEEPTTFQDRNSIPPEAEKLTVDLLDVQVDISPPAYTALPKITQSELQISTIKGAEIEWKMKFSNAEDVVFELVNSVGNSLPFTNSDGEIFLKDRVKSSGIYAIRGHRNEELVYESDYFPLEAKDDLAPVIQPADRELYTYHFTNDPKIMDVQAKISDDFKVSEVYLVATLARGSGENVKFRENRIPVSRKNFKSEDLSVRLDLNALDFRHGDELYYYWAAVDNKTPEPNFSRSDTYFINYVDSAGLGEEELIGMAIHVMPDYFRSQRQIIIDTQKLLAEQKSMSEKEFNAASNEIGYDQKMLRLRYGQYLGEEFEETAGGGAAAETGDAENLLEGYEHRHDEESEAGVTANVILPSEHEEIHDEESHSHENGGIESVLDAYLHNHEDPEANTYFEESTKGTLKAALEEMWEAELYMRLFEPEKALPYQEKALELLKKVQQKSRVYVKRTGFDPPPIKPEEKRLTGDLDDLKNRIEKEQMEMSERLEPLAAEVLGLLAKDAMSQSDQLLIQKFGELWTVRMNYSGMEDWSVLLLLQELKAGKITEEGKQEMFDKLYPLIPKSEGSNASFMKQKELEKAFWSKLK